MSSNPTRGPHPKGPGTVALRLTGIRLVRDDRVVLDDVDWVVRADERWVVLGPNGGGKTSLVRIASMYLHPSAGVVEVLGATLGRVDVRRHRRRIGLASAALADRLRPGLTAADVVMTAANAALEPWWHPYDDADRGAAVAGLDRMGVAHLADRTFGTLSSGERSRVLVARAYGAGPGLVLLDEPMAGLDLGGRETLVARLGALAADPAAPPTVLVTHHVDEIPPAFTHALLLGADGRVAAAGPLDTVLTAATLSAVFAVPLDLVRRHDRWLAWSPTSP